MAKPVLAPPTPSPSPAGPQTVHEAALSGLGALASGEYDPVHALSDLQTAQTATAEREALRASQQAQARFVTLQAPKGAAEAGGVPQPGIEAFLPSRANATDLSAVKLAETYLGTPYVWGGEKPGGFDCSGLLQFVWAQKGVNIPRTTYDQFKVGKPVTQLRPGDAVFFKGSDSKGGLPGHVGMYIGGGKFIEAPHTGAVVRISRLAGYPGYVGARRYK